ncbi:sensor histidine kinase [Lacrimispora saccharolytica]|uniref:Integral membrane sensor signal transduction histidine kinase n=1 Tax=Lacrimispora saccharolytica (strain ATCC 35040 / DSM 2544 / NRCC 2533 / WM1) TaxID=610130 RepID=D9R6N5_LACSW|nr:histidine kinase [Lacrimispora saccharolytica]ADL03541.1 integral membrane sensor signal transduction histidine kinase [[Clostridium] saccharolyticum WM1]QRV18312.1 histidine kinase [Lacrimispora saccharolytica]
MIKYLVNRYRGWGIAKKTLIILLFVSIVPVTVIEIITCIIAANTLKKQMDILVESNMKLSQKGLEDFFSEYDSIIMSIYTENEYALKLEKLNVWDSRNYYLLKKELENDLENISYLHPEILGIGVVTQKKECILYDSVTNSTMDSYCFPEKDKSWLAVTDETFHNTQTVYSRVINREAANGTKRNLLYLGHRIADINNYRQGTVGSILICLDETNIRETYSQENENEINVSFLCDANGSIVSSTRTDLIGTGIFEQWDDSREELFSQPEFKIRQAVEAHQIMNNGSYSIYTKPVLKNQFVLVSLRDNREPLKDFKYIFEVIILLTILIIITSILIMIRFAGSLQFCVAKITSAMDRAYKGDYTVQIEHSWQDEFGKIARHFNHMVQKIDQSGKIEKEALLREKNAELKALEAQINPHFLYNTLDAINWIAIENEQFLISRMLKNLGSILRYSVHKSNGVVSVRSEVEYLKQYIFLQQQRFSFSFHCIMDVDEEVLDLKMHKLLFQPLIENAIIHGFPGGTGQDMLMVSIRKKGDKHLMVQVEDNGKGMHEELVRELNHYDYSSSAVEGSIGVRNVIMRIKYYYGEEGHFLIESNDRGTRITAEILFEE